MQTVSRSLTLLGEAFMICGLIWAAITFRFPSGILPEALNRFDLAMVLAVSGIVLVQGLKRLPHRPAIQTASKQDAQTRTASDWARVEASITKTVAEQRARLGPLWARPQERLCLRPAWPQRPTGSWIGGRPMLPPDTPWPSFDGVPGLFLAQIALPDLPETLWRGAGPREGWLVIFGLSDACTEVKVLHVTGPVAERMPPQNVETRWLWPTRVDELAQILGPKARIAPRWFLKISADDPGFGADDLYQGIDGEALEAHEASACDAARAAMKGVHLARPDWHPFDWPTLLALLALSQKELRETAERLPTYDGTEDRIAVVAAVARDLDALARDLQERARNTAFEPEIAAKTCTTLLELGARLDRRDDPFRSSLLLRPHGEMIETRARQLFTTGAAPLPQMLYNRFAPMWEAHCATTEIYMGRSDTGSLPGMMPADLIIDLPTTALTGIHFGDMSRWYVQTPPLDLLDGRFDRATAQDTHG